MALHLTFNSMVIVWRLRGNIIYTFIRNECNTKREDKKKKNYTVNTIAHND